MRYGGFFFNFCQSLLQSPKKPSTGWVCHSSFLVQDAPKYSLSPGKQAMQNGNRESCGNWGNSQTRKERRTGQATTKQVQALRNIHAGQELRRTTEDVPATTCKYQAQLQLESRLHTPFAAKAHTVFKELQHLKWRVLQTLTPRLRRHFQLILGWDTKQAPGTKQPSLLIQPWSRATSQLPEEVGGKKQHRTAGSRYHCPRFCWHLDFWDSR